MVQRGFRSIWLFPCGLVLLAYILAGSRGYAAFSMGVLHNLRLNHAAWGPAMERNSVCDRPGKRSDIRVSRFFCGNDNPEIETMVKPATATERCCPAKTFR
jgi:hypothetical protein